MIEKLMPFTFVFSRNMWLEQWIMEEGLNLDLDENGKLIGLEILDATDRYPLADIFNISTDNLVLEEKQIMKTGHGL